MKAKFFFCKHCGNVVVKFVDSGVVPFCCGEEMVELKPNTTDGMVEKHLPVFELTDEGTLRVKVGSSAHPMSKEHHIAFLAVETERGGILHCLDPEGRPESDFCICCEKPVAVYAYCNLHGLWMTEFKEGTEAKKCCKCKC